MLCGEAVDKTLKPICRHVRTDDYTVVNAHDIPLTCDAVDCAKNHTRKANPFSASADHIVAVSKMRPGDPRLVDPRAMQLTHLDCNRRRQAGGNEESKVTCLKDWGV